MSFEHQDNSGSLFVNGYKTEEKHPDHQGSCKIICEHCGKATELRISAWINDLKDKTGRYFGLKFSKHIPREQSSPVVLPDQQVLDDDIPF